VESAWLSAGLSTPDKRCIALQSADGRVGSSRQDALSGLQRRRPSVWRSVRLGADVAVASERSQRRCIDRAAVERACRLGAVRRSRHSGRFAIEDKACACIGIGLDAALPFSAACWWGASSRSACFRRVIRPQPGTLTGNGGPSSHRNRVQSSSLSDRCGLGRVCWLGGLQQLAYHRCENPRRHHRKLHRGPDCCTRLRALRLRLVRALEHGVFWTGLAATDFRNAHGLHCAAWGDAGPRFARTRDRGPGAASLAVIVGPPARSTSSLFRSCKRSCRQ
jgi:hypothetical protein